MSIKNKKWLQKDGTKIRLGQMSDEHLKNTIAMLERNAHITYEQEVTACCSISFNGEAAQDAQDSFLASVEWQDYLPDIYWDMKELFNNRIYETN